MRQAKLLASGHSISSTRGCGGWQGGELGDYLGDRQSALPVLVVKKTRTNQELLLYNPCIIRIMRSLMKQAYDAHKYAFLIFAHFLVYV